MTTSSIGTVLTLFISMKGDSQRIEKAQMALDKKGIIEDKYYDTTVDRSVLITSRESYRLASFHQITMPYGSLGENILIDYNPYHLSAGDQLQIGEVILEISQNCTMCDHLSKIDKNLPNLLRDDRGIFAKVLVGGMIKKSDKIILL